MPMFFYQRKFSQQTSELRTIVMAGIHNIMSTTSSCQPQHVVVGKWTSPRVKKSRARSSVFLMGIFGPQSGKAPDKSEETVVRARFALQNRKQLTAAEKFWKTTMRTEKCARDCIARARLPKKNLKKLKMSRSVAASDLCGRVRTVDAARMLANLVRRSGYAGLQAVTTKRNGTAARSN